MVKKQAILNGFILTLLLLTADVVSFRAQPYTPSFVSSLAWSPNGNQIAVGMGAEVCREEGADYSVHVLNASTRDLITQLLFHVCTVESVDWSPDGSRLVSSGGVDDRVAVVWNTTTWASVAASSPPLSSLSRIADIWNSDSTRIVGIAEVDSQVRIWDSLTGLDILTFRAVEPTAVVWSPEGNRIAVGQNNGQLGVWDAATGIKLLSLAGQTSTVTSVDWSPDGSRLVTGSMDGSIRVWDVNTETLIALLQGSASVINRTVWNPTREQIVSASDDGAVSVWEAETGTQLQTFQAIGSVYALDWSPDGNQIAYGGEMDVDQNTIQIQQVNFSE